MERIRMKKQPLEINAYANEIGLDYRLLNAPRTKEQADKLLSLQITLINYDAKAYKEIRQHTSQINDPYADKTRVLEHITAIESYLDKYYDNLMFMSELNVLKHLRERIEDNTHITTEQFVDLVMDNVVKELYEMGFTNNIIIKGIKNTPALKTSFTSILKETYP